MNHPHCKAIQIEGRSQVFRCSRRGCSNRFSVTKKRVVHPPTVLFKMAQRAGWTTDQKKGQHVCPICK